MIYKIKARNFKEAYQWFTQLPFYTFKNFINKDDLLINSDHINHIEIATYPGGNVFFIHYNDIKYFGKIFFEKLNVDYFKNTKIVHSKHNKLEQVMSNFTDYKHMLTSPITMLIIYFIVAWYSLTSLKHIMFPEITNPKPWVTMNCNENCITYTSYQIYTTIIMIIMTYGAIAFGIVLLKLSKKKSNLLHYKKSFDELRLFFIFFGGLVALQSFLLFSPSSLREYKKIYLVRFDQEYKDSPKGRSIASDIFKLKDSEISQLREKR